MTDDIKPLNTELNIISPILGYAGTIDCIAEYQGKPTIFDWKTSTKRKTPSAIKTYIYQLAAYKQLLLTEYSDVEEYQGVQCGLVLIHDQNWKNNGQVILFDELTISVATRCFNDLLYHYYQTELSLNK